MLFNEVRLVIFCDKYTLNTNKSQFHVFTAKYLLNDPKLCWIACLSVRVEPQINQLKHNYRKRHSRRNRMAPMSIF